MLPESKVVSLQRVAEWSGHLLRLQSLLQRDSCPSVADLGDLAWLRGFDREDLQDFAEELHQVLIAAISDQSADALDDVVHAWRVTAQEIEDPLRRSVLTGEPSAADFEDAPRPDGG
jgi:hypothetical protein